MPLGGATILWNEAAPADSDNAGLGDDEIRSLKTSLRQGLDSEHNWPTAGGAATGYHRFGSARVFSDVESNVSSSGTDGRLFLTSDTSRLFGVGSGGTVFLGGARVLQQQAYPGVVPQRAYWVEETGSTFVAAPDTSLAVTFLTAFNGVPYTVTSLETSTNDGSAYVAHFTNGGATSVTIFLRRISGSSTAATSNCTVHYRSLGTKNF